MEQHLGFCTTVDGVRIAYATIGEGPVLVRAAHWYSHLEREWELSGAAGFYQAFAKHHTLVRYDGRGTGLSDRFPAEISFETFIRDLEAVVDALRLERFALFGTSQGGPISIMYALRHPERVTHIVLSNSFARGALFREGVGQGEEIVSAMRALIRRGWGSDDPSFRAIFTTQMMPGATPEQAQGWNELERISASAEVAERIFAAIHTEINIVDRLREVRTPTLVLHVRDDRRVPFEEGRILAAHIPNARFVPLPGINHAPLPQDPSFSLSLREISAFLGIETSGPLTQKLTAIGEKVSKGTKHFEASTTFKILAILAVIASIVSLILTFK